MFQNGEQSRARFLVADWFWTAVHALRLPYYLVPFSIHADAV